jgi:hypothetical protein
VAATAAAWVVSSATASADQLPLSAPVGVVASSAVTSPAPGDAPNTVDAATDALNPVTHRAMSAMTAPAIPPAPAVAAVPGAVPAVAARLPHPPADLDAVTDQVRSAVLGVGTGLAPAWNPAVTLLPSPQALVGGGTNPVPPDATAIGAPPSPAHQPGLAQPVTGPAGASVPAGPSPVEGTHTGVSPPVAQSGVAGADHTVPRGDRLPPVDPFVPPSGSSDSGSHPTGGLAGGSHLGQSLVEAPAGVTSLLVRPTPVHTRTAPGEAPGTTPD